MLSHDPTSRHDAAPRWRVVEAAVIRFLMGAPAAGLVTGARHGSGDITARGGEVHGASIE